MIWIFAVLYGFSSRPRITETGDRTEAAKFPARAAPPQTPAGVLALVTRRRFRPKIQVGAVGLDFLPDSEHAKTDQRKDEQFFHSVDPSTSTIAESAGRSRGAAPMGCMKPSKLTALRPGATGKGLTFPEPHDRAGTAGTGVTGPS